MAGSEASAQFDGHVVVGIELRECAVSRDVVKVAAHGIDLGLFGRRAAELVQVHAVGAATDGAEVAGAGHLALVERGLEAADVELVAAPTLAACTETRMKRSVYCCSIK